MNIRSDQMATIMQGLLDEPAKTIEFTKADGTTRVMKCTLAPELITYTPPDESEKPKQKKKSNPDVQAVFDVECDAWRSFRWDRIKSYENSPI